MSQPVSIARVVLFSTGIWMCISIVAGLGLVADAVHRDAGADWLYRLLLAASIYMLFAVATPFVYLVVRKRLRYPLRPGPLLAIYLAVFVIFFAFYVPASAAIYMTLGANGAATLTDSIARHSFAYLAIDSFILTALFIACCAIVYYGKVAQQRAQVSDLRIEQERLRGRMLELQSRALKGQLEPHFLFNALNAISLLVRKNDTERSLDAIYVLSNLLRRVIELNDERFITVDEEVEFAKNYLGLQKLRFGSRIRDRWDIRSDLLQRLIPPMLIQPLLENAVRHGVEPVDMDVEILVRLTQNGDRLALTVTNVLPDLPGETTGTGNGLAMTRERLRLLYGENFLFDARVHDRDFVLRIELGKALSS